MQQTTDILKDIELMLLKAELRIAMINGELSDITSSATTAQILTLQLELESVHQQMTKLENTLLKKINTNLKRHLEKINKEVESVDLEKMNKEVESVDDK